jgi:hypothetical protein
VDKDIRFTEKKVDESWKDQAAREKGEPANAHTKPATAGPEPSAKEHKTSQLFLNFVTSLGLQAMMHLGEIPNPETKKHEVHLDGAREIIDLLVQLKEKTQGNLSREESEFFTRFLPELQLKFAQRL